MSCQKCINCEGAFATSCENWEPMNGVCPAIEEDGKIMVREVHEGFITDVRVVRGS